MATITSSSSTWYKHLGQFLIAALPKWDQSEDGDFWSAALAGQLCGHMQSNRKICCISFYCNRKKPTSKSKHHFLPKDIINIFKMARGNLSNTRENSKWGQKGSVPCQDFSSPAPLSISWMKLITYIHLHTLLSLVYFRLGGALRAQSCNSHITIFGENSFPKSPTGYRGLITQ